MTSASEESVGCLCFANKNPGFSATIRHICSDFQVHEIDERGKVVYLNPISIYEDIRLPDEFYNWNSSGETNITLSDLSNAQCAYIYYNYTNISILNQQDGKVILSKTTKSRNRPPIYSAILYKENMNEQEAISHICQLIGCQKKSIGFAGTKDKRGITTQLISIETNQPKKLLEINSEKLMIGSICPTIVPIRLGQNVGNRFSIALRQIQTESVTKDTICKGISDLAAYGFINYFGMQRFGTTGIPTHQIGKLILQGRWLDAVHSIIDPSPGDTEKVRIAKEEFQKTHNAESALILLPRSAQSEYSIFKTISTREPGHEFDEPEKLISSIDRRQRTLYVHAYQSYLWNFAASKRFQKHGLRVVKGDFVLDPASKEIVEVIDPSIYSIFDVVLPLASESTTQQDVLEMMEKDGLTPYHFKKLKREYALKGDWRNLIAKPEDVEWSFVSHQNMDDVLIDSDLDNINGITHELHKGNITSLIISFSLKSGMYATMCLRELLKRSTEWYNDSNEKNQQGKSKKSGHCIVQ